MKLHFERQVQANMFLADRINRKEDQVAARVGREEAKKQTRRESKPETTDICMLLWNIVSMRSDGQREQVLENVKNLVLEFSDKIDLVHLVETHTKKDVWKKEQEVFGGKFIATNPTSGDRKGGVAQWVLTQEFREKIKEERAWSAYYLHSSINIGRAKLHCFTVYIPPCIDEEERFGILRNLFWAIDDEIRVAKGLNHFIIAGDFNRGGISDMEKFATPRKIHKVNVNTRGNVELDAFFCSESVKIIE